MRRSGMALSNAQRQARWRVKRDAREKLRPEVIEAALVQQAEHPAALSDADRLALADKIANAAMHHLHRSQELAQLARRVRTFVTHTCIALALLTMLAALAPTRAQDTIFHDAHGRTTGSARTDSNG